MLHVDLNTMTIDASKTFNIGQTAELADDLLQVMDEGTVNRDEACAIAAALRNIGMTRASDAMLNAGGDIARYAVLRDSAQLVGRAASRIAYLVDSAARNGECVANVLHGDADTHRYLDALGIAMPARIDETPLVSAIDEFELAIGPDAQDDPCYHATVDGLHDAICDECREPLGPDAACYNPGCVACDASVTATCARGIARSADALTCIIHIIAERLDLDATSALRDDAFEIESSIKIDAYNIEHRRHTNIPACYEGLVFSARRLLEIARDMLPYVG